MKILAVDDEPMALASLSRVLERHDVGDIETCRKGREAIERIRGGDFDIVLLDILMPDVDGIGVLEAAKPFKPATEFIVVSAVDDLELAVKAIHLGAYDYLVKPVDNARLLLTINRAYERRGLRMGLAGAGSSRGATSVPRAFSAIITQSPRMLDLLGYTAVMAASTLPILITGESGTGKELLAHGIHRASPNAEGPFVPVNVAAISESLFESHFFGHLRGAFTGAERDFKGYFEQADRGTLFLDEIGEIPLHLQAKLLRTIEDKVVTPIGSERKRQVNVRIVSSTNSDMDKACREGRFRLDLLHRLKSAHIHLPPLREREGDIPFLAAHFLRETGKYSGARPPGLTPQSMAALSRMKFEGNVRELARMIERSVLLAQGGWITPEHLGVQSGDVSPVKPAMSAGILCSLKENEDMHVIRVLRHARGSRTQAAAILGITARQLHRKIARIKEDPRWADIAADL